MKKPYWYRVIDDAPSRIDRGLPPFSHAAVQKAKEWQTCACGVQSRYLDRNGDGCPDDPVLDKAGHKFNNCILEANSYFGQGCPRAARRSVGTAERTMRTIDHRSAELLHEMITEARQ